MSSFAAGPQVLHFFADWHDSHAQMTAVFSALPALATASPHPIQFLSIEAEGEDPRTTLYNVTVVPTFVLLRANGAVFQTIESPDPAVLSQAVIALVE